MNYWQQFLWVIYPYLMLCLFIVGHLYRYVTDQYGWTAQSSEFLEKKFLRWGSLLFHWGIIFALLGHFSGLLLPKRTLESFGVTEELYHAGAIYAGGIAGIAALIGIVLLVFRRTTQPRIRITSGTLDLLVVILLLVVIVLGLSVTLGFNLLVGDFDYRETISPWFRGLLLLRPDPGLMVDVPLFFKLHVLSAFTLFGLWPFTRLVHVWSLPLNYLHRSYIVYRNRNPRRIAFQRIRD